MIQKSMKTTYKLKDVYFDSKGFLYDEDDVMYDLIGDLKTLFGNEPFTLTAVVATSETYDELPDSEKEAAEDLDHAF